MKQEFTHTLFETLFNLMILGDDRAITASIVAGELRHQAAGTDAATTYFTQGA